MHLDPYAAREFPGTSGLFDHAIVMDDSNIMRGGTIWEGLVFLQTLYKSLKS